MQMCPLICIVAQSRYSRQKTVWRIQDISISLLTSFCSTLGCLVGCGHWMTVTGEEPPSVWLFQRKIYRSAFGSNFKNVLKPAIYPRQSRSANGEPQFSWVGGTIALMGHLGQSVPPLLSGLDVSRLEPLHRLGLSPTRDFSLTDNRTQLNRLARQPALYPFPQADGRGRNRIFSLSKVIGKMPPPSSCACE